MKATGIVRSADDPGRIVIPKEIRRTLKIREDDPSYTTLTSFDLFCRMRGSCSSRYVVTIGAMASLISRICLPVHLALYIV